METLLIVLLGFLGGIVWIKIMELSLKQLKSNLIKYDLMNENKVIL